MPKQNPKHKKSQIYYERKRSLDSQGIPKKYFVMGFIFIVAIVGVVLLVKYLPNSPLGHGNKLYIEDGDMAELHYKLWKVNDINDLDTNSPPTQESKNFITNVSKDSLINGFYYKLIDREIGEIFEFVIDKETDEDHDGKDDDTGKEILGYADGSILYFWVQVLNITKSEDLPPASALGNINLPSQMNHLSKNYMLCNDREFSRFEFLDEISKISLLSF
ncbi:MAG: hypothetical protein ACTSWX_10005 [Promethearchaeota archaeon]